MKKLGENENALKYYEKACELEPDYSLAHYNLAVHLSEIDELDKAFEHYEKAFKLEPANVFACLGIANTMELKGNNEGALKLYQSVLTTVPYIKGVSEKVQVLIRKEYEIQAKKLQIEAEKLQEAQNNFFE